MLRLASFAFLLCANVPVIADDAPPPLPREFRGVWVAAVANIDWPSRKGLTAQQQQAELIAILDKAAELNLNVVILQVRPMADALYPSTLEPWSEYLSGQLGKPPSPIYDPLARAIREAHARGLELHAWFNPYRARHPSATSPLPDDHLIRRRPDVAKVYGTHHWLNPTHRDVQDHSLAVILDVVRRYDVDGIHIDDYFYPYKEKDAAGNVIPFPDDDTWQAYQQAGGKLARDDWRRAAVNGFVQRMYRQVKEAKPWVKVGISPFGIWRPGHPEGIAGLDQYGELYADAKLWLNEGWCDYFNPQLYWPIKQSGQSYPRLLDWWVSENTSGRHLCPGNFTSRVTGKDTGWPASEIIEQIEITTRQQGAVGNVHFSMRALLDNRGQIADELVKVYAAPALVPAVTWVHGDPPARPALRLNVDSGKTTLHIRSSAGVRLCAVRSRKGESWSSRIVVLDETGNTAVPLAEYPDALAAWAIDRSGRQSAAAAP